MITEINPHDVAARLNIILGNGKFHMREYNHKIAFDIMSAELEAFVKELHAKGDEMDVEFARALAWQQQQARE